MQIAERPIGDLTILDLKGRLVAGDGDDVFRDAVDRLARGGRMKLLLNMDEVPYIDSGGLGVLVSKLVTLRRGNGRLKLCNLRPRCSRVLEITRLLTVFEVFASEDDGIRSFVETEDRV
jgi:anti-sigma B factor antagonist